MRAHFNVIFLVILLVLIGYMNYLIFAPFLVAIFLAFIFSQLFKGWYQYINRLIGKRESFASFLTCLILFLILIIPLFFIGYMISSEINNTYQSFIQTNWRGSIEQISQQPTLQRVGIKPEHIRHFINSDNFTQNLQSIGNFFFEIIKQTYQSASHFLFMAVIMFFTLYYFFKDSDTILKKIIALTPLKDNQERLVINKFINVSKATLQGSLVIAVVQGTLQGILFGLVGVASPVFWGVITFFFSLIPMLGAGIVWLPVGLIMILLGHIWQGLVILLVGFFVVSTIDNFLRPYLVGNQVSLHPLLVFFATLGGIAVFGLTGILIGPIIVVLFLTLLDMYRKEFKQELERMNNG